MDILDGMGLRILSAKVFSKVNYSFKSIHHTKCLSLFRRLGLNHMIHLDLWSVRVLGEQTFNEETKISQTS